MTSPAPLAPETAVKAAKKLFRRKDREVLVWSASLGAAHYTICADADATNPVGTITAETFETLREQGLVAEHDTLVSIQGIRVFHFRKSAVLGA